MKINLKNCAILALAFVAVTAFATAVTDFKEYLPQGDRTSESVQKWNTLLGLFVQKAGDTLTGKLTVSTGGADITGNVKITGVTTNVGNMVVQGSLTSTNGVTSSAGGFTAGASAGLTGVLTNSSTLSTNIVTYTGGIITAVSKNP